MAAATSARMSPGVPRGIVTCELMPPWKGDSPLETLGQCGGLHSRRRDLNRVEGIDANVDQVVDDRRDGTAGVEHHGQVVAFRVFDETSHLRLEELAIQIGTDEQRRLCPEVAAEIEDVDQVRAAPEDRFIHVEKRVGQALHHAPDQLRVLVHAHPG